MTVQYIQSCLDPVTIEPTCSTGTLQMVPMPAPIYVPSPGLFDISQIDPVTMVEAMGTGFVFCGVPMAICLAIIIILRFINGAG